jgi:tetratricopeptide (TPR) repeat protein
MAERPPAESVPIRIRVGLNSGEVVVRSVGSDLRMDYSAYRGEFAEALRLAEEAVRTAESNMVLSWMPATSSALGWILAWTGQTEAALPSLEQSVSMHDGLGINAHLSILCCRLAEALHLAGRPAEAAGVAERALGLARRFGERGIEAEALLASAGIQAALAPDDPAAADARYGEAIGLATTPGMRPLVARGHLGRGELWLGAGDTRRGRASVATATSRFRETDMRFWLGRAEAGAVPSPVSQAAAGGGVSQVTARVSTSKR